MNASYTYIVISQDFAKLSYRVRVDRISDFSGYKKDGGP